MLVLYLLIGLQLLGIVGMLVSLWAVQISHSIRRKPRPELGPVSPRSRAQIKRELDMLHRWFEEGLLTEVQFQRLTDDLIDELWVTLKPKGAEKIWASDKE